MPTATAELDHEILAHADPGFWVLRQENSVSYSARTPHRLRPPFSDSRWRTVYAEPGECMGVNMRQLVSQSLWLFVTEHPMIHAPRCSAS